MAEETKTTVDTTAQTNEPTTVDNSAEIAQLKAEVERFKNANDKSSKEAAEYKRQLRAKQSDEEAKASALAEAEAEREAEREKLKAELNLLKATNAYKGITDEKVVAKLIDAVSDSDHTAIAKLIDEQCRKAVADAEANWLANRPRVNNGSGDGTPLSKKDIMAIKDFGERQRAIAENMNLFRGGN